MTQSPSLPFRPSRAVRTPRSHFVVEQGEDRGAVIDPALVQELVRTRQDRHPLDTLSAREREVLGKLDLPDSTDDHRRVLAVLVYLSSGGS